MTPTAAGRHCAACQKTVVDFTQKTDAEILAILRQATSATCGRLRASQLGRPLVDPAPGPRWRAWLGAVLAAGSVLGATEAAAQVSPNYYSGGPAPTTGPATTPAPAPPVAGAALAAATPAPATGGGLVLLRGIVTDSATHEGLPGVTVLLDGTSTFVSTDITGAFALPVAAGSAPVQLAISFIGYATQRPFAAPSQPLSVALKIDTYMLGAVAIGLPYHQSLPWLWHPRRFFNWSKYWVTKPFRE